MESAKKLPLDTDILLETYGITRKIGGELLTDWLNTSYPLNQFQTQLLTTIYEKSANYLSGWNEEELKMKFISFLFLIADIEEIGKINTFFERPLSAIVNSHRLSVVCDCLIAKPRGLTTPQFPYFFLQEFKKSKSESHDPEGQMLGAMLIAQFQNQDNKPIYGSWLVGNIWYFTVLSHQEYSVSNAFDATNEIELLQIICILKRLKELILNR